ncbi:MAG: hypothetical protein E6J32_10795 [Chloroflexi bacterium]|nr:MAG: hypothetical protein E6J32_10795 [Chloroflexota bacterium]
MERGGSALLRELRGGRHQPGRLPRRSQLRRHPPLPGDLLLREQPLGDLRAAIPPGGRPGRGGAGRLQSHSTDDDQRAYRDATELAAEAARDPIPRMRDALMERGWLTTETDTQLREEVGREVERATEAAESASDPDPGSLGRHVYADA